VPLDDFGYQVLGLWFYCPKDFKIIWLSNISTYEGYSRHFLRTISLEMPVPSQGHYGFHSFPVVD
jgi:hypothetical protein